MKQSKGSPIQKWKGHPPLNKAWFILFQVEGVFVSEMHIYQG